MSPARSPAASAGLPAITWAIRSPSRRPSLAASGGGSGAWLPAMPSQARRTRPVDIRALMIRCVVELIGTASPTPIPATAVLTPTIRPRLSASTPPLLPGLSAASVWMTSSTTRPSPGGQRPAEAGHDAGRHAAGEPERVAERDHELADLQLRGVAELDRRRHVAAGPQHGEVGERVAADDVGGRSRCRR